MKKDMKVLQFRVTREEHALLKEAAWEKRMSLSEWLRKGSVEGAKRQVALKNPSTPPEPLPSKVESGSGTTRPPDTQSPESGEGEMKIIDPTPVQTYDTPESVAEKLESVKLIQQSAKKTFTPDPKS